MRKLIAAAFLLLCSVVPALALDAPKLPPDGNILGDKAGSCPSGITWVLRHYTLKPGPKAELDMIALLVDDKPLMILLYDTPYKDDGSRDAGTVFLLKPVERIDYSTLLQRYPKGPCQLIKQAGEKA